MKSEKIKSAKSLIVVEDCSDSIEDAIFLLCKKNFYKDGVTGVDLNIQAYIRLESLPSDLKIQVRKFLGLDIK